MFCLLLGVKVVPISHLQIQLLFYFHVVSFILNVVGNTQTYTRWFDGNLPGEPGFAGPPGISNP